VGEWVGEWVCGCGVGCGEEAGGCGRGVVLNITSSSSDSFSSSSFTLAIGGGAFAAGASNEALCEMMRIISAMRVKVYECWGVWCMRVWAYTNWYILHAVYSYCTQCVLILPTVYSSTAHSVLILPTVYPYCTHCTHTA
jgi:hypothetical protein